MDSVVDSDAVTELLDPIVLRAGARIGTVSSLAGAMAVTAAQVAAGLRLREERRRAIARSSSEGLLARLPDARRVLVDVHGAQLVTLFGWLASGEPRENRDVDLAVDGLLPAAYFAALADVTAALGCMVYLVRAEDAPATVLERIAVCGRPL